MPNVLVVTEDQPFYNQLLENFNSNVFHVNISTYGKALSELMAQQQPDVVILDIKLSTQDSFTTLAQIRRSSMIPVVMLTSSKEDAQALANLELKKTWYLYRGLDTNQIRLYIQRVLKRDETGQVPIYEDSYIKINLETGYLEREGNLTKLTEIERRILICLIEKSNETVTYAEILTTVWGDDHQWQTEYVHTYMNQLRKKIEADPRHPQYLLNVFRTGYRFQLPDVTEEDID